MIPAGSGIKAYTFVAEGGQKTIDHITDLRNAQRCMHTKQANSKHCPADVQTVCRGAVRVESYYGLSRVIGGIGSRSMKRDKFQVRTNAKQPEAPRLNLAVATSDTVEQDEVGTKE